jgi:DNA-binding transcriptional LysR family regulator
MFEELFAKGGLSLDRLRVLLEVREAGSIAAAAGRDPVRQSQYSRQRKELESFFETPLTERRGRTLALTGDGEELARIVKDSFSSLSDFGSRVSDRPMRIRFGAGESLIQWVLIPLMPALHEAFPNAAVQFENLRSAEILEKLESRDLDMGLVSRKPASSAVKAVKIGVQSFCLYVPHGLLSGDGPAKPESLLETLPVAIMARSSTTGERIHREIDRHGMHIRPALECSTYPGLERAMETGRFAVILPDTADNATKDIAKKIDLPFLKPLTAGIYLVWPSRLPAQRGRADQIRKWLEKRLTGDR